MSDKIRIGICGYGNLGRGVEATIVDNNDLELAAVFSRRTPKINSDVPVVHMDNIAEWRDRIDVMILCGGSATDLRAQGPELAALFNTVDSFDTHAKIPDYYREIERAALSGGHLSIISVGWDPGLFSLMRLYSGSVLPRGKTYTFWGEGVSQGHSGAIRGIEGVLDAVQYTLPVQSAMERIRGGETPEFSVREKHTRLCYVVAAEDADRERIEREIKEMPHYFDEYDTTVRFITLDELKTEHGRLPHGGHVIHIGETGDCNKHVIEYSLKLDSNPEFTSSALIAYARAAYKLYSKGERGARTVFDIPPILLSSLKTEEILGIL